jgi:hypothetical protein
MTPQEIYDTVAKHLFAQGKRSGSKRADGGFQCKYRGPDGTKCAVGVLMPDEFYDPVMEGSSICGLFDPDATAEGGFPLPAWMKQNLKLLISLQDAHDYSWYWHNAAQMKARLHQVALDHNLSADVLVNLKFAE